MFNNLTKCLPVLTLMTLSCLLSGCGQKQTEPASPAANDGVVQSAKDYRVYDVFGGKRHYIPNPATLDALGVSKQIKVLSDSVLDAIPAGSDLPALSSRVIQKASTGEVFVLESGKRRHVPDPETLKSMQISPAQIQGLPDASADAFPLGTPLPHLSSAKPVPSSH